MLINDMCIGIVLLFLWMWSRACRGTAVNLARNGSRVLHAMMASSAGSISHHYMDVDAISNALPWLPAYDRRDVLVIKAAMDNVASELHAIHELHHNNDAVALSLYYSAIFRPSNGDAVGVGAACVRGSTTTSRSPPPSMLSTSRSCTTWPLQIGSTPPLPSSSPPHPKLPPLRSSRTPLRARAQRPSATTRREGGVLRLLRATAPAAVRARTLRTSCSASAGASRSACTTRCSYHADRCGWRLALVRASAACMGCSRWHPPSSCMCPSRSPC